MVGSALRVSSGRMNANEIEYMLKNPQAGFYDKARPAGPSGLYLLDVEYTKVRKFHFQQWLEKLWKSCPIALLYFLVKGLLMILWNTCFLSQTCYKLQSHMSAGHWVYFSLSSKDFEYQYTPCDQITDLKVGVPDPYYFSRQIYFKQQLWQKSWVGVKDLDIWYHQYVNNTLVSTFL